MKNRLTSFAALFVALFIGALFVPAPTHAVPSNYCSTLTRCMNTSYYSGWTPVYGVGTLPMDNHFHYWDSTAWDTSTWWAFPSTCLNQAAINTAGNNSQFPLPACDKDPNYANTFLSTISGYISNNNFVCVQPLAAKGAPLPPCAYDQRQAIGAAMIINTMMGVDPNATFTGPTIQDRNYEGVMKARQLFPQWAALVRQYDSEGLVDWNFKTVEQANHLNSTWVPLDSGNYQWGQDDVFFSNPYVYPVAEIKFSDPRGGAFYEVNRRCGNINGAVNPFPSFNVSGVLQSGPGTPPGGTVASPGGPLQPGTAYDVRPGAWNAGPGQSSAQTYVLTVPSNIAPTSYPGGSWNATNRTVTWTGVKIGGLGIGSAAMRDFNFTVNAGTPNGTILSFSLVVGPHDPSGANSPAVTTTFEVQNPRYPSVVGLNGDIHAGGGICYLGASSGNIKGSALAGSGGQYVVSSAGQLSGLTSGGSDSLKLGKNGGYSQVCRPDLLAAAKDYVAAGSPTNTITCTQTPAERDANAACTSIDLAASAPGVYVYTGTAPLNVHGIVKSKVTIVARNADVHIDNTIAIDTSIHPSRQVPSLGIIASGDIDISRSVTRVDAYLFSNSTINTCVEANSSCSTNTLLINGFLMAKNILLNRLGPTDSVGSQVAERIILNPQIYLNPPTLFTASTFDGNPSGLGELPPLY